MNAVRTALLLGVLTASCALSQEVFLRDEFENTELWKELNFPKIPAHTKADVYTLHQ